MSNTSTSEREMEMSDLYIKAEKVIFDLCGGGTYAQVAKEPMLSKAKEALNKILPKGSQITISPKVIFIRTKEGEVISI